MNTNGWVDDPDKVEEVMATMLKPLFSDAASSIMGTGRGKLVLLHENLIKILGKFPVRNQGNIGSCFPAGQKVLMANGTEKNIEDVKIGDLVVTHKNNYKRVTNLFNRQFSGDLYLTEVKRTRSKILSTDCHQFFTDRGLIRIDSIDDEKLQIQFPKIKESVKIIDLSTLSDNIIIDDYSIRIGGSKKILPRYIDYDEDICWLIGMYAAEGGCEKIKGGNYSRVTFTVNITENEYAEKIHRIIKDKFNLECKDYFKISGNSRNIRCTSNILCLFFKYHINGSCLDKSISDQMFKLSESLKTAFVKGFFDGDGCYQKNQNRITAVSASYKLLQGFKRICLQLGAVPCFSYRKARKQSKESYSLDIYGRDVTKFGIGIKQEPKGTGKYNEYGTLIEIREQKVISTSNTTVYCLEVEDDHSFICNDFAVKNCVAASAAGAIDVLMATDLILKKDRGSWQFLNSIEANYGLSRVQVGKGRLGRSDGSIGVWQAKAVTEYGTLGMTKYGKVDLTQYSVSRCRTWGNEGLPKSLESIAKQHPVKQYAQVRNFGELCDSIASGYPVTIASRVGYSKTKDKNGVSRRSGSWSHQMYCCAIDDRPGQGFGLIQNSWGCYSSDTEILTDQGWKLFSNLSKLEKVATLNKNGFLEYQYPTAYQDYEVDTNLLNFKGRNIDLLVTENHNMFAKKQRGDFFLMQAKDICKYITQIKFKKNCKGNKNGHVLTHKVGKYTFKMDDWLEFLGYFLTEGSAGHYKTIRQKRKRVGIVNGKQIFEKTEGKIQQTQYSVYISQIKPDSRIIIQKCLEKMGIRFSISEKGFYINSKDICNELLTFGKCDKKYIPDYVWDCHVDQMHIFYEAMMLGDGSRSAGKNTFYTSSAELANQFQILLLNIGYSGDIRVIDRVGQKTKQGKNRCLLEYHIRIKEQYNETCPCHGWQPELIPYKGKVYCVTVPNSVIFVKRNGNVAWCGNSNWNTGGKRFPSDPDGSFWASAEDIDIMLKAGDSWSYADFTDYPSKEVDISTAW